MISILVAEKVSKLRLAQLWFAAMGFLLVLTIVLHCSGLISMHNSLFMLIIPAIMFSINILMFYPAVSRTVKLGWLSGILAVFLYDLSRIPFIIYGWEDFIPNIGAWLSDSQQPSFLIGYFWRYIGNGGGMGVSFFMLLPIPGLKNNLVWNGILYGLFVFTCLILTLLLFDEAQQMMFSISPLSFTGSLVGHIIYGGVLGFIAKTSPPCGHLS